MQSVMVSGPAQVAAYLGQFRCWQAKVPAVTLDLFGFTTELFKLLALFGDDGCKLSVIEVDTTDIRSTDA